MLEKTTDIEKTTEYKVWAENVERLNNYINSLSAEAWGNGYADYHQREYDILLSLDPRKATS